MWFESLESILAVLIKGVLAYAFIVFVLRVTGKRTLSKMNAFDLIVTVALGSTLATVLLSPDVTLADGGVALALLVVLQYGVTWLSVRIPWFQNLVKAEPRLLFYGGQFLEDGMRKERVTREEILAAIRSQGIASMSEVSAVILETDGTLSVLRGAADASRTSSEDVSR